MEELESISELNSASKLELEAYLTLTSVSKLGNKKIRALISYFGSARKILDTPLQKLELVRGIGTNTASEIKNKILQENAKSIIIKCKKEGISILNYLDNNYPHRLHRISNSPIILYKKGNIDWKNKKTIGIVGTRKMTTYGRQVVEDIIEQLRPFNVSTISGLAYGVDICVHRESIRQHIPTVAVVAGGHDYIYPKNHLSDAQDIIENHGAIISEYPLGTETIAQQFPARNRVIAGLSDVLIVIEAAEKGGALITAEIADSYDIPVFAVPGDLNNNYSKGCNNLIHFLKARIFISIENIFQTMGWLAPKQKIVKQEKLNFVRPSCSAEENMIIDFLEENDGIMHIDELNWQCKEKIMNSKFDISIHLLTLEIKNITVTLPGNKIRLSQKINYFLENNG